METIDILTSKPAESVRAVPAEPSLVESHARADEKEAVKIVQGPESGFSDSLINVGASRACVGLNRLFRVAGLAAYGLKLA